MRKRWLEPSRQQLHCSAGGVSCGAEAKVFIKEDVKASLSCLRNPPESKEEDMTVPVGCFQPCYSQTLCRRLELTASHLPCTSGGGFWLGQRYIVNFLVPRVLAAVPHGPATSLAQQSLPAMKVFPSGAGGKAYNESSTLLVRNIKEDDICIFRKAQAL